MSPLQIQFDRIRRRRWLVIAVTLVALIAALASSLRAHTSYTGKSTLQVVSQGRSPDQDATLARGLVDDINDPSSRATLLESAHLPGGVGIAARTAATSPIIYIEATASSAKEAQSAATVAADIFREKNNKKFRDATAARIKSFTAERTAKLNELRGVPKDSLLGQALVQEIQALQGAIISQRTNTDNQLVQFQAQAGTTATVPATKRNLVLALLGGLILGSVAALGLASLDDRLSTPQEVRERLDLDTLAVIHATGGSAQKSGLRAQRLKGLANVVNLSDLSRPATLAITTPRAFIGKSQVASGLASFRALQGERTLLLQTDLHQNTYDDDDRRGVVDFLATRRTLSLERMVVSSGRGGVMVIPAGRSQEDPYALFARDRFGDLVEQATNIADLVVIDAPAIIDAAEAQVICAAADRTILVLEEGITKARDAQEACQLLEQVGATILGVVLSRAVDERSARSPRASRGKSRPRPEPAADDGSDVGEVVPE
jgi:polysaccharide biosynthesis transport protein